MEDRFKQLPRSLRERSFRTRLAGVPALVAVPEAPAPAPVMLWMHGRTVDKELDPGRYLRWLRAGIATIAIDLPGHGERDGPRLHDPECTPGMLTQMLSELDGVVDAAHGLQGSKHSAIDVRLDTTRMGIGGMSAGGMVTLRRLCEPHGFLCAAVESTTGWLGELYNPTLGPSARWPIDHDMRAVEEIDPMNHLSGFRAISLLALHSEADQTVPWSGMRAFLDELGRRYESAGVSPRSIEVTTWTETGAPFEHAGFGRVASEAKSIQTDFLSRHLLERADGAGP
ncbi:MAG: prolyl oligopeptidase family serine peptidase [Planctomycetota bacterium]